MLMFDNSIFASLIPQFLMVLGFFSVIIAPSLTSNDKTNTENKELKIELSAVSSVNQDQSTSYHFQDYSHQTQDVISEGNSQRLKIPIIKEIYFTLFDIQLLKNEVNFLHFSRPPPFS